MAGVYVVLADADAARLDAIASRLRHSRESERRHRSKVSYVWLGHDPPERFAPANDPVTGVHVVVAGRLSWPPGSWQHAARLPYEGGAANRLLLERYLASGPAAVAPYNGAAAIVIWDPRDQTVHLWTDQFGYHPAFVVGSDEAKPAAITTFPDVARADPALTVTPDHVSMAEFLRAWRITPPHTYYKEIKHAGAATYRQWDLRNGASTRTEYWRPFEDEPFRSLPDAAAHLAQAVRTTVEERTAVADRPVFFVSGGADSRVMLYAAKDPARVRGVNLYECPTAEAAIARTLCERSGATYIGFQRDNDYYPRQLTDVVKWSGAMWSAEDSHYLGAQDVVRDGGVDLVMTACTTDWLFKGYGLEKRYRRVFGRNLPLKAFTDERVDGFLPNVPRAAPPQFSDAIEERMGAWFAGVPRLLRDDRARLLAEDRRIRPACYTVSVSGAIMYRTYPYDTFLADSRVAACYSRIRAEWKLNGDAWGRAAGIICAKAGDVVDSNFGWAVDAGVTAKLLAFMRGWVKRRIAATQEPVEAERRPPSSASWPEFGWYALHSNTLREFWVSVPTSRRALIAEVWGSDPWSVPLQDWASAPNDFFRILTLLHHLQLER